VVGGGCGGSTMAVDKLVLPKVASMQPAMAAQGMTVVAGRLGSATSMQILLSGRYLRQQQ
jgi:hypothetical protein